MSDNKDARITFRLDPETKAALDRYKQREKAKQSEVVHTALHRFLLAHDPKYRAAVLGETTYEEFTDPPLRVAEEPEAPDEAAKGESSKKEKE